MNVRGVACDMSACESADDCIVFGEEAVRVSS
jgi:hypothetical protein